jgi:hypothetical protein
MAKFALKRGKPTPASQLLAAFETTIHTLPQDAPDHEVLGPPPPLDAPLDTARSVPCLI